MNHTYKPLLQCIRENLKCGLVISRIKLVLSLFSVSVPPEHNKLYQLPD